MSLGEIIDTIEKKAIGNPFDVPVNYVADRENSVTSSTTNAFRTKFIPAFRRKEEVQFGPRVKRGDGTHRAIAVSDGGKTVKVEVNFEVSKFPHLSTFLS